MVILIAYRFRTRTRLSAEIGTNIIQIQFLYFIIRQKKINFKISKVIIIAFNNSILIHERFNEFQTLLIRFDVRNHKK